MADETPYTPSPKHETPVPSEHHRDCAQQPIERRDIDPRTFEKKAKR